LTIYQFPHGASFDHSTLTAPSSGDVVDVGQFAAHYKTPTEGGSSGAGGYVETGQITVFHVAGGPPDRDKADETGEAVLARVVYRELQLHHCLQENKRLTRELELARQKAEAAQHAPVGDEAAASSEEAPAGSQALVTAARRAENALGSSESSFDDSDEEEVAFIPSQILEKEVCGGATYYHIEWADNKGASWAGASDVDGDTAFTTVLQEFNRRAEAQQPAQQGGGTGKAVKATQSKRGGARAAKQGVPAQVPVASGAAPAFGKTKRGRRTNLVDYNESSLSREQRPMYHFAGNYGQGPAESGAQYGPRVRGAMVASSTETSDEEDEEDVPERIIRRELYKGRMCYLVKWMGYGDEEATHQIADLVDQDRAYRDSLREFRDAQISSKIVSPAAGAASPADPSRASAQPAVGINAAAGRPNSGPILTLGAIPPHGSSPVRDAVDDGHRDKRARFSSVGQMDNGAAQRPAGRVC
jgi:hypothetical protein